MHRHIADDNMRMRFKNSFMKKKYLVFCFLLSVLFGTAQHSRFSIEGNYGFQKNYFVTSYNESPNSIFGTSFYKKAPIGTIGGIELKYRVGKRGSLGIGYSRSVNSRTVSYRTTINSVSLSIADFKITHKIQFFQFGYEYAFQKKNPSVFIEAGLFYTRPNQQEIDISRGGSISFEERNFDNSRLEEGGIFIGLSYMKKIDTKFRLGIKSRLYYLASTNSVEALTLTPVLFYSF